MSIYPNLDRDDLSKARIRGRVHVTEHEGIPLYEGITNMQQQLIRMPSAIGVTELNEGIMRALNQSTIHFQWLHILGLQLLTASWDCLAATICVFA
ncbi:hypothetical protein SAMN05216178_7029 [Pseudomonas saponiphila]|uniref:Uncharacterized protein n=1 Tax=Pseudomonas saponiphila TaxID=556534 RepID=A0A1H5A8R2_9PSED|nr:hypothetical protein SAMN05216178_7029 [Pseudomonas saponiphila]